MTWWPAFKLWCKHNWKVLVIGASILIAFLAGNRRSAAAKEQLKSTRELYKKEREALKNLDAEEDNLKQEAQEKYKNAMAVADRQMHESRDELKKRRAERVKELLSENSHDPKVIDDILYKEFGIKNK